ncbi:MAG: glycosyltransferase family 4 protein [Chitinophagaceae bacterium]|nr:glycosyltransferase family 4 protein [Chitinophagaceae bacterium]
MKVAIYSGGIQAPTFIRRLMMGLADQGIDVLVFGPNNGKPPPAHRHIHVYENKRGLAGHLQFIGRWFKALLVCRSEVHAYYAQVQHQWPWASATAWKAWQKHLPVLLHKPDIFHLQWAVGTEEWFFLKQHFGIKMIVSLRGAHINYSPLFDAHLAESYRRYFPQVDAFHAVSKAIGREASLYGASPNKINVIYSGLPLNEFPWPVQKTKQAARTINILSVGRAHWKKGYRYAIDAIHALKQKGYAVQYTIIGGMATEHVHHIAQLNLQENVIIKQRVPFDEVKATMMQTHILLLPSVEEGIANVVLEAMALGTLVVSSNCGGMEEAIEHQVSGFIFPLRNVDAMVNCLEQAIAIEPEAYQQITSRARQYIESHHTAELLVQKMIQLYQSI